MKRYYIFGKDGKYSFGLLDLTHCGFDATHFGSGRYNWIVRKYDESCARSGSLLYCATTSTKLEIGMVVDVILEANKTGTLDLLALIKKIDDIHLSPRMVKK